MEKSFVRDEIGSEFWDVPVSETVWNGFSDNIKWFISGTSALQFVLADAKREREIRSAAIPSWCCECMITPFLQQGIEVFFYSVYVDEDGVLTSDYSSAPSCDLTLAISYFGYTGQRSKGTPSGVIVRDLTHEIFCFSRQDAAYYFGSLRKWAGFWTGGFAWKHSAWIAVQEPEPLDAAYVAMRKGAMEHKLRYLSGCCEDKSYLEQFEQAEDFLDRCGVMSGSPRDVDLALHFDVATIRRKRRENAMLLLDGLREYALFQDLAEADCPLFVPILLDQERRDGLRRFLIRNRIYCPVHWGISDAHRLSERQRAIYERELSIVCDQRYGKAEMTRITEMVTAYLQSHP